MNKIIEFLKQSNRYKHLIGGLLVGILAFTPWTALYAAAVAASCLELKDKLKGGLWDWIDWSLTVIGGILSALFWWLLVVSEILPFVVLANRSKSTFYKILYHETKF